MLIRKSEYLTKHDDVYVLSWESCTNVVPLLKMSLAAQVYGVWALSFDLISPIATYLGTA